MEDGLSGRTTQYFYDAAGRLGKTHYEDAYVRYTNTPKYNANGQLSSVREDFQTSYAYYTYTYDEDNRPLTAKNGSDVKVTYDYTDSISRLKSMVYTHKDATVLTTTPTYFTGVDETYASTRISRWRNKTASYDKSTYYEYDDNGNITKSTFNSKQTTYVYDGLNQLIRENNQAADKTWTYSYDAGGNIIEKKEYAYTTGTLGAVQDTITYTYGDSSWGDLLTKYDGTTITSDNIGNMLSDGTWTYTWKNGRQLAAMTDGTTNLSFKYDSNGIRTEKKVGNTTWRYIYDGSRLVYMTNGSTAIYFRYDAEGNPMCLKYKGENYFYLRNAQNDIVGIVDSAGALVVEYTYDAWGNPLSTTGSMATTLGETNPLRYRSYFYDTHTGLYYLQSRYYDPEMGRFINADGQISNGDILGANIFAYCGNNPVNRTDSTGEAWWHWALGAVVVAACAVATVVTCGGFAAAATAVCMVGSGIAAATTASTVAAAAFIGSATVYGAAVLTAASNSSSLQDFNNQGNWGTVGSTIGGATMGGLGGYVMHNAQTPPSSTVTDDEQGAFLPDSFYSKDAPKQSVPNSSFTHYKYNNRTGEYERSSVYYDFAGRQTTRIDWTNHGYSDHGNPHVHFTTYNARYRDGKSIRWD